MLDIDKLHNLRTSSDIITVIEARRIRWAGRVARVERLGILAVKSDREEINWKT
jgi:hypothetical protein